MRAAQACIAVMSLCLLSACADTLTSDKSYLEIVRSYKGTLTQSEKKGAISDLQRELSKDDGAASEN